MTRKKRGKRNTGTSTAASRQTGRRLAHRSHLVRLIALGLVLVAAAWALRIYLMPPQRPRVVAALAAEAPPEVASLLHEAEDVVTEFCRQFPGTVDALDAMATLHSQFGQIEEAIELWQQCLEVAPTFVNAHFQLGVIERDQGRNSEATQHFRQIAQLEPDSPHVVIHLAKSLIAEGSLEEAIEVLRAELQRQPDSVATLVLLGDAHLQLKEYEKAKEVCARAVDLAPGLTSVRYSLGTSLLQLGDREAAKEQMAEFQKLKARDERLHRDQLKDTQLGLQNVRRSVAEIEATVAKAYIAYGDPPTGEGLLRRAFQLDPSSAEPARVLAWLLEREGRVDEAVQVLSDAAAALPDDFTVHLAFGQLLARIGRMDEAEKTFRHMVELTPNEASAHVMLARFYLGGAAKPKKAKDEAQRAVDLAPTAKHYALLAEACFGSGELEQASAAVDRAIALEPGGVEYRRLREAISKGAPSLAP